MTYEEKLNQLEAEAQPGEGIEHGAVGYADLAYRLLCERNEARSVSCYLWKRYAEPFHWFRAAGGAPPAEDARLPEKHPWLGPVPLWAQEDEKEADRGD